MKDDYDTALEISVSSETENSGDADSPACWLESPVRAEAMEQLTKRLSTDNERLKRLTSAVDRSYAMLGGDQVNEARAVKKASGHGWFWLWLTSAGRKVRSEIRARRRQRLETEQNARTQTEALKNAINEAVNEFTSLTEGWDSVAQELAELTRTAEYIYDEAEGNLLVSSHLNLSGAISVDAQRQHINKLSDNVAAHNLRFLGTGLSWPSTAATGVSDELKKAADPTYSFVRRATAIQHVAGQMKSQLEICMRRRFDFVKRAAAQAIKGYGAASQSTTG